MAICLECSADLHMAQLMPLLLTASCFSKVQIDFTFVVRAYPGSPGQRAVKRVCVCNSTCDHSQSKDMVTVSYIWDFIHINNYFWLFFCYKLTTAQK